MLKINTIPECEKILYIPNILIIHLKTKARKWHVQAHRNISANDTIKYFVSLHFSYVVFED